jgi:hypothetical protein
VFRVQPPKPSLLLEKLEISNVRAGKLCNLNFNSLKIGDLSQNREVSKHLLNVE